MNVTALLQQLLNVLPGLVSGFGAFVKAQTAFGQIFPQAGAMLQQLGTLLRQLTNAVHVFAGSIGQFAATFPQIGALLARIAQGPIGQIAYHAVAGVRDLAVGAAQAFAGTSIGQAAIGAAGAVGGALSSAAAAVTPIVAALGPVGVAAATVAAALVGVGYVTKAFAQAVLDANRGLAEFSGAMAAVFAESDVRDIQRSMKAGEEQAGTAGYLAEGLSDLKDTLQPIGTLLANILNLVGGALVRLLDLILKPLSLIASLLNPFLELLAKLVDFLTGFKLGKPEDEDSMAFGEWLDDIAKMSRTAEARKDPRFGYFDKPRLRPG